MTIIVAFILEAFVFRMNYSRKSQDSEGLYGCPALSTGCRLVIPRPVGSTAVARLLRLPCLSRSHLYPLIEI